MTPRQRALHAYRQADVPVHVAVATVAIWVLVALPVFLHLDAFDLPATYPVAIAWAVGGFAAAFFYFLTACE